MIAVTLLAVLLAAALVALWLHARPSAAARYTREFHETYGAAIRDVPTAVIPEAEVRLSLIREEVEEYAEALASGDIVAIADALGDIAYVVYGGAHNHGIDLDAVLAEIHRSNMTKLGADGKPIYRHDGKVLKGPNFEPPNLAAVLGIEGAA